MKIANSLSMASSHQVPLGIPFPNGTFYNNKLPQTEKTTSKEALLHSMLELLCWGAFHG